MRWPTAGALALAAMLAGTLEPWPLEAAAKRAVSKKASAKSSARKKSGGKKSATRHTPPKPHVTDEERAESKEAVQESLWSATNAGIQNPAALVPFYEMLYQSSQGKGEPLRVLHFGDSHTASDDWPGAIRARFQSAFGNGGPGFTHAGRPFVGYRRFDSKAGMSRGWTPSGLLNREGDGMNGLSGVSVSAKRAGETITLKAEGAMVGVFYYSQPDGGALRLEVDGVETDVIQTTGENGAGYYRRKIAPGIHDFTLRTLSDNPIRVYGWVVENEGGVTWETLGINGAQADLMLGWNEELLRSHIENRDPALIVLAYGTNEARRRDWTYDSYKQAFTQVLRRLREFAPTASILVIGPPDQSMRVSRRWTTPEGVDHVLAAQHDAALENGCAFWDVRAVMGGKGAMRQWVQAGLAQGDFVHFTSPGYKALGETLYDLMMGQYGIFTAVRRQWIGTAPNGPSSKD